MKEVFKKTKLSSYTSLINCCFKYRFSFSSWKSAKAVRESNEQRVLSGGKAM